MTIEEKVEFIRRELPDYQRTLEAAAGKRTTATAAKQSQVVTAEEGHAKLEETRIEVESRNLEAERAANQAEIEAQAAEQKARLQVDYLISIIKDEPAEDPTPAA